jgi:hypothetical protein
VTHGRTFYRCGCIRVQCHCPGPHLDTVLPIECKLHRAERSVFEEHALLFCALAVDDDRERLIDERQD